MDKDALRRQLREQFEQAMESAIKAVEDAPDGRWIAASEWPVRDAFLTLMGDCYQRIVQAKIDATPAAADTPPFSPSGQPEAPRQGPPRGRRGDRRRRGDA